MGKILNSFSVVCQTSFLSSVLILGTLFFSKDIIFSKKDNDQIITASDSINSTSSSYIKRSAEEWIGHAFPMFVGVDMNTVVITLAALSLTHKSVISCFLGMLLFMEGLFQMDTIETTFKTKVLVIGSLFLQAALALVMSFYAPVASILESLKLSSTFFMWQNFKLIMKVEVCRLILKNFLFGQSGIPSTKEEMLKSVVKRRKQCFDCMVHETKQLVIGPIVPWIIALLLHMIFTETSSMFNYDFVPDIHMALPNSGFFKHFLIILFEVDHILMLNAILKLSWMSGVSLLVITLIFQLLDVRKSSTGDQVEYLEILQDILGIDINRTKLWRVFIKIMVCAVTPWTVRILIGFGHYWLWDIIGGTSSPIFWFGQIYLHFYCIIARLRIFSHLICFGVPACTTNESLNVDDNEKFKEWEDFLKMPRI